MTLFQTWERDKREVKINSWLCHISQFGWHRRGCPFEVQNFFCPKSFIGGLGTFFVFRLNQKFWDRSQLLIFTSLLSFSKADRYHNNHFLLLVDTIQNNYSFEQVPRVWAGSMSISTPRNAKNWPFLVVVFR